MVFEIQGFKLNNNNNNKQKILENELFVIYLFIFYYGLQHRQPEVSEYEYRMRVRESVLTDNWH